MSKVFNLLSRILTFSIFLVFLLFYLLMKLGMAQTENREVIAMFKPGIIQLPQGQDSSTVAQATINSNDVRNTLNYYQVEWIIKMYSNCNPADTIMTLENGKVIRKLKQCLVYKLRVPDSTGVGPLADSLNDLIRDVSFANGNSVILLYGVVVPNDIYFTQDKQWGLLDSFPSDTVRADIRAPEAWEATTGNSSFKIGIIDNGVNPNHPDLIGRVGGSQGPTYGQDDHGTRVAGIAGAKTNNSIGIAGVDWQARLLSESNTGSGAGTKAAVDSGATALNLSYGHKNYLSAERAALAEAYNRNVTCVLAMRYIGGSLPEYPAEYQPFSTQIVVGAHTTTGAKSGFSGIGQNIDLLAPGGDGVQGDENDIFSTYSTITIDTFGYAYGTSFAAPFVTGTVALLKSYYKYFSNDTLYNRLYNDDVEKLLNMSAFDITTFPAEEGWDILTGWGRINARAAIDSLSAPNHLVHDTIRGSVTSTLEQDVHCVRFVNSFNIDGRFPARRYKVTKNISPSGFLSNPKVWGVGVNTIGNARADDSGYVYGISWCEAVNTGGNNWELKTYVYQVLNPDSFNCGTMTGTAVHLAWVPCQPDSVRFGYAALGKVPYYNPTNLTDTLIKLPTQKIQLNWSDNNLNELGHYVERRSIDSTQFVRRPLLPFNSTNYTDDTLKGSETYVYRVVAHSLNIDSTSNDSVIAKNIPNPPIQKTPVVVNGSVQECCLDDGMDGPPCQTLLSNKVLVKWSPPDPDSQKANTISFYRVWAKRIWDGTEVHFETSDTSLFACLWPHTSCSLWVNTHDTAGDISNSSNRIRVITGLCVICDPPAEGLAAKFEQVEELGKEFQLLPNEFFISQNYPNPFNVSTDIRYALPEDVEVLIDIYNILGQKVRVFDLGYQNAGYKSITWDGKSATGHAVSSGLYLYRIKAGNFVETRRMTLLK